MTDLSIFRVYEPGECGADGYPRAWRDLGDGVGVKDLVRAEAGHRCARCLHPYRKGAGEWSPCDPERCLHGGPVRLLHHDTGEWGVVDLGSGSVRDATAGTGLIPLAQWRILTVHHLRLGHDAKRDLRWWNLAPLCQRCHLVVQGKVLMERVWPWPHTPWFRPYAAGFYAWSYLGEDLTRAEVDDRLEDLLALEEAAA